MDSNGCKHRTVHLPISMKLLLAFLVMCGCLTIVSGVIYYKYAENVVMDSIQDQTSLVCQHVVHEFYTHYAEPVKRELKMIAASPQLDSYLMSSQEELLLHRADVERLLLNITKGFGIHLSTVYVDASGQERIAISGNKRRRRYRSLSDLENADITGQLAKHLFEELSSDGNKTLAYTPPFLDGQNRPGLLVGIVKQEPEAGGFGGVIIQHCSLENFIQKAAQDEVLNTPVVWIRTARGDDFLVPPDDAIQSDPWVQDNAKKGLFAPYVERNDCMLFADEEPLLTVACSVPSEIIAAELTPVMRSVTTVFSGLLVVSVLGSYLISRSISKPIKSLTSAVQKISGKNLEIAIPVKLENSRDEMGILAASFIKMTHDLKESTTSIDDLNALNSELMTSKRELQNVNDRLESNERQISKNVDRLTKFNRLAAQRELKMRELKQEINGLLAELGRDRKFKDTSEISEIYAARGSHGNRS